MSLINPKPCWNFVRDGDSSEDIGSQQSKVENHGEEEYRNFDARHGRIETRTVGQESEGNERR